LEPRSVKELSCNSIDVIDFTWRLCRKEEIGDFVFHRFALVNKTQPKGSILEKSHFGNLIKKGHHAKANCKD
jgi:hypothetical protein